MCNNCQNSTEDIFYQSVDTPVLETLNLGNGTYLNTILEKIDTILGGQYAYNFNTYTMPYLKDKYSINNIRTFAEATSSEFKFLDKKQILLTTSVNTLTTTTTGLNTRLTAVEVPKIQDTANAGFTVKDNIFKVLQKLTDRVGNIVPVVQESLIVSDSASIRLTNSGVLGHTLGASVKLSLLAGNKLELKGDGLYVAPSSSSTSSVQNLTINGYSLGISGGNYINLPLPQLNLSGTFLSIVGSNGVDIGNALNINQTPLVANDSTTIDFTTSGINNHTLTAQVKLSSAAGNQLTNNNGLYVPSVNIPVLLSDINLTPSYKTAFSSLVASSVIPLSFTIINSGGSTVTVNYLDVNNISKVVNVVANFSVLISDVKKILTPSTSTLKIEFLGFT